VFAFLDRALINSGQLRELLYGLFIVAIFLGFRRGFAHTLVALARRLVRRGRDAAACERSPLPVQEEH
jgi:hypothetical protein